MHGPLNVKMWCSCYTGWTLFRCMLSSFTETLIIISRLWSIHLMLILGKDSSDFVCKRRENFGFPILYYISHAFGFCLLVKDAVFLCVVSRSGPCKIRLVHAPSSTVAVQGFKVAVIPFLNVHVKPYIAWERQPSHATATVFQLQLQRGWWAGA